ELAPQGIHVAHIVIDGAIDTEFIRENFPERYALKERDGILNPDAIADNYWLLHQQHRSAWTHELALRPWLEKWWRDPAPARATPRPPPAGSRPRQGRGSAA